MAATLLNTESPTITPCTYRETALILVFTWTSTNATSLPKRIAVGSDTSERSSSAGPLSEFWSVSSRFFANCFFVCKYRACYDSARVTDRENVRLECGDCGRTSLSVRVVLYTGRCLQRTHEESDLQQDPSTQDRTQLFSLHIFLLNFSQLTYYCLFYNMKAGYGQMKDCS